MMPVLFGKHTIQYDGAANTVKIKEKEAFTSVHDAGHESGCQEEKKEGLIHWNPHLTN